MVSGDYSCWAEQQGIPNNILPAGPQHRAQQRTAGYFAARPSARFGTFLPLALAAAFHLGTAIKAEPRSHECRWSRLIDAGPYGNWDSANTARLRMVRRRPAVPAPWRLGDLTRTAQTTPLKGAHVPNCIARPADLRGLSPDLMHTFIHRLTHRLPMSFGKRQGVTSITYFGRRH